LTRQTSSRSLRDFELDASWLRRMASKWTGYAERGQREECRVSSGRGHPWIVPNGPLRAGTGCLGNHKSIVRGVHRLVQREWREGGNTENVRKPAHGERLYAGPHEERR